MLAVRLDRYGPPEVMELREVPDPVAGSGEILVRVHASVATPPDCAFRSADPFIVRFFAGLLRPRTLLFGDTFAGEIVGLGPYVTGWRLGQPIYGAAAGSGVGLLAAVKADGAIAPLPPGLSYGAAASVCEGYLTAQPFLRDVANLQPGQSILINGASGSVGSSAFQLARAAGAVVTGVCSAANADLVRTLGADAVIDYTRTDFTQGDAVYDVVFDAVGKSSFARCRKALKPTGIYMTTVPSWAILRAMLATARSSGRRARLATTGLRPDADKARDLLLLNDLVTSGAIRPVIDRTYDLTGIVAAHRYVETGRKRGSVVIALSDEAMRVPS